MVADSTVHAGLGEPLADDSDAVKNTRTNLPKRLLL